MFINVNQNETTVYIYIYIYIHNGKQNNQIKKDAMVHIPLYAGPSPPCGVTQLIFCFGSLMSHVLQ